MTEFFPAPLGPSHPPPKEWSADSLILLFICVCKLLAICPRWGKLLAICPRKNNIIYLRGQIDNNLHTQKILFFCVCTFIRGSPSSEAFWSEVPIPLLPVSRHVVEFSRILWQKRPLTKGKQWQKSLWRRVLWPKSLWRIVLWHKGLWGKNLWPQPSWYPYGTIHGSI